MKGEQKYAVSTIDMRSDVLLVVELLVENDSNGHVDKERLQITENSMTPWDAVSVIQYCAAKISREGKIEYNQVLEDLKIKGD